MKGDSFLKLLGIGQKFSEVKPSLPEDPLSGSIEFEGFIFTVSTRNDIVNIGGME